MTFVRWLAILCAAFLGWTDSAARATPPGFVVAPPPPWIERLQPEVATAQPASAGTDNDGVQYLLVDDQVRFDGRERVTYRHRAVRATNERGVESVANIKVQFDPSFESLTIHSIVVRRADTVVSRLKPAAIRLLQRETELEALIYDGSVTASAFLTDVRVGDIVDYEYSIRGENPVFGHRQFGYLSLQWGTPVARVHARVSWPSARTLQWKLHAGAPAPRDSESGGFRERVWDLRDVPMRTVENEAPGSYDPFWGASWSEFDTWAAVARWARPLYGSDATPAASVVAEARRVGATAVDPEHRLAAVLRFVQSEVRYLGIEIGADSHAPSRPEDVLRRRFGDCKDKTRLMIAMLAALGIEAQPALVNTQRREGLRDLLATPGAFNHVVVRARTGGRDWWLDPTRPAQAADLQHLAQADYGAALLVDDHSDGLVPMAGEQARRIERDVRVVFDARGPHDRPVPYTVTTRVRGAAAEILRGALAGKTREAMQRDYLNFYAGYYRGVSVAKLFAVADNPNVNELTVTEHYEIKDFWHRDEARRQLKASIEVPDIADVLRAPQTKVREAPLSRPHPLEIRHHTEVLLSDKWSFQPETRKIHGAAFTLERKVSFDAPKGRLLLEDHFLSRHSQVAGVDVPAHIAELDSARDTLDFGLQQRDGSAPPAPAEGPHWLVACIGTLALIGLLVAARRLYLWDPTPWPVLLPTAPPPPQGLRGWLLLAALGLVLSPLRVASDLMENASAYGASQWLSLTQAGGEHYDARWGPLLLGELLCNMATLVLLGLLLVLFARRRSSVPRLYIALLVWGSVVSIADNAALQAIPAATAAKANEGSGGLWMQFVVAAAWAAYFVRSRRVAATFVERRGGAVSAPPNAGVAATVLADTQFS